MAKGLPQGFPATVFKPRDIVGETIAKEKAIADMQPVAAPVEYDRFDVDVVGDTYSSIDDKRFGYLQNQPAENFIEGSNELLKMAFVDNEVKTFQEDMNARQKDLMESYTSGGKKNKGKAQAIAANNFFGTSTKGLVSDENGNPYIGYDKDELQKVILETGIVAEEDVPEFMESLQTDGGDNVFLPTEQIRSLVNKPTDFRDRVDYTPLLNELKPVLSNWNQRIEAEDGVVTGKTRQEFLTDETGVKLGMNLFGNFRLEDIGQEGSLIEKGYTLTPQARSWAEDRGLIQNSDLISSRMYNGVGYSPDALTIPQDKAQEILDEFLQTKEITRDRKRGDTRALPSDSKGWTFGGGQDKTKVTLIQRENDVEGGDKYIPVESISVGGEVFEGRGVSLPKSKVKIQYGREGEPKKEYILGDIYVNENGEMVTTMFKDISIYEKVTTLLAMEESELSEEQNEFLMVALNDDAVVVENITKNTGLLNSVTAGFSNYVNEGIKDPNDLSEYLQIKTGLKVAGEEEEEEEDFDWANQ